MKLKLAALLLASAVVCPGQKFTAIYANLETGAWMPSISSSIAPVPAVGYATVPVADGLRLYETGPAWAGVLWSHNCPLPALPTKGQVTLSMEVSTDDAGVLRSQAQEFDIMLVDGKGNVFNGSNQLNNAEGGNWQVVNSTYKWVDLGFNPGRLPADTWVPIAYTLAFDTAAQTSAIIGVSVNGKTFIVPTPVWIPAQALGWTSALNTAHVQIQEDNNAQGGAWSEKVRNITVTAQW